MLLIFLGVDYVIHVLILRGHRQNQTQLLLFPHYFFYGRDLVKFCTRQHQQQQQQQQRLLPECRCAVAPAACGPAPHLRNQLHDVPVAAVEGALGRRPVLALVFGSHRVDDEPGRQVEAFGQLGLPGAAS